MVGEILKCKCGGDNSGTDWTGVTELHGWAYQTCMIHCLKCEVDVGAEINTDKPHNSLEIEEGIINLWNLINKE